MGCDIYAYVERRADDGRWQQVLDCESPFDLRSYACFGFLAGVRNYSATTPIVAPRGFPEDASAAVVAEYKDWDGGAHAPSWLLVRELVEFDYDQLTNDRRVTRQFAPGHWNGGVTGEPSEGTEMTYRAFLGGSFLRDVEILSAIGDPSSVRVVFWFDS